MTSPDMDDEAMKAMARRIVNANSNYMSGLDRGQINFSAQEVLKIALAAIIETQERCAALAERYIIDGNPIHPDIPADAMAPDARMIAHTTCQHIAEAIRSFRRDGE